MNVASLDLCKELFELSEWETHDWWMQDGDNESIGERWRTNLALIAPAYDLGDLIRKLPTNLWHMSKDGDRFCIWIGDDFASGTAFFSETPEDAVCKLAIELFKSGVLRPEAL